MQRCYKITGLVGALVWGATILLRETPVMEAPALAWVLGIAPNFGALLLGVKRLHHLF